MVLWCLRKLAQNGEHRCTFLPESRNYDRLIREELMSCPAMSTLFARRLRQKTGPSRERSPIRAWSVESAMLTRTRSCMQRSSLRSLKLTSCNRTNGRDFTRRHAIRLNSGSTGYERRLRLHFLRRSPLFVKIWQFTGDTNSPVRDAVKRSRGFAMQIMRRTIARDARPAEECW